MSVKLKEFSELLLLADSEPKEPRLEPEETDNVLTDKLKHKYRLIIVIYFDLVLSLIETMKLYP